MVPADTTTPDTATVDTSIVDTSTVDTTAPRSPDGLVLSKGASGTEVTRAQDRLRDLGFDPGPSDGVFGTQTEQAVWAFEAMVMGRTWQQQTGTLDERSMATLFDPSTTVSPRRDGIGDHTEIYIDLQALVVFHGDAPVLIAHISTGSGETWCALVTQNADDQGRPLPEPAEKDVCGDAVTPGGVFEFYRRVEGDVLSTLGGMYNPVYFNYGIAVAGAINVPRQPVSHGGVRIPMAIAEYFPSLVQNKDDVFVWDGVKEPEDQRTEDMLPHFSYPNPAATVATAAG